MEKLLELLKNEMGHLPDGPGMTELLSAGTLVSYPAGGILIDTGRVNRDVFIVADGIVRFVDMNGDKERTFAFAMPGTVFMSKYSFVMGKPSYYQVMACCESHVLQIPYDSYWDCVSRYPALALWMLQYAHGELYYQEYKNSEVFNGTAKERFVRQLADRPEILTRVPQKIIASYLGISPEYYCAIKREYFTGKMSKIKKL